MPPAASTTSFDELVRRYSPQQPLLVDRPPTGEQWIHELKLDGYRAGALLRAGRTRLLSRRGNDLSSEFPELIAALRSLRAEDAVIDGEIVVLDRNGRTDFQALQNRARSRKGLAYIAFDLLWLDGEDLSRRPLLQRKELLRELLGACGPAVRFSEHFSVDGAQMFKTACQLGAEGIVSKRVDAAYQPGTRNAVWQKTKCIQRQEVVIGGFTDPTHKSRGVGSLLIGYYDGDALVWAGKVSRGHGFTERFLRELRGKLDALEQDVCPFNPRPEGWLGRNAHWLRPELVAEVSFSEWTEGGQLRHASLEGFRTDKAPRDVVRERPVHVEEEHRVSPRSPQTRGDRCDAADLPEVAGVVIRNPQTRVFTDAKLTRLELARFYEEIAEWALPHLERRPLTLVRCRTPVSRDDALRTQCAFLHHTANENAFAPQSVPRVKIREQKKLGEYLYIDSVQSLVALVANGVTELHTWNARVDAPELPDRVVFDIDPGEEVSWSRVIEAARLLREELEALELESWPKSTGGKGLHVVVPFRPERSWDEVFAFSRAVAEKLVAEHRGFTTKFSKADRSGRILLDYKRNYRTSIAVAAFSTRARPHAPVAVPLSWREVTGKLRPDQWTVLTLPRRLAGLRGDPWAKYWKTTQRLTDEMLERVVRARTVH